MSFYYRLPAVEKCWDKSLHTCLHKRTHKHKHARTNGYIHIYKYINIYIYIYIIYNIWYLDIYCMRYLDTPPLIFFQVMVNHVTSYTYSFLLPVSYIYFMKLGIISCSENYLQRCSLDFFAQTLGRAALKTAGGNCWKSFNVTTQNTFKTVILQNSSSIMQKCLSQNRCYFLVTFVLRLTFLPYHRRTTNKPSSMSKHCFVAPPGCMYNILVWERFSSTLKINISLMFLRPSTSYTHRASRYFLLPLC